MEKKFGKVVTNKSSIYFSDVIAPLTSKQARTLAANLVRAADFLGRKPFKQGKMQRQKGHTFERYVVQKMKKLFPRARRQLEFQKDVAAEGTDLAHTGRYRIQCKRYRQYASISAIFQVKICPIEGGCPVLITQGDRQEAMAVLPFEEFLTLIARAEKRTP